MKQNQSKYSLSAAQLLLAARTTFMRIEIRSRSMAKQQTMSQVVFQVFILFSCVSVSVQGPWPSVEPCCKWFFKSSYHFHTYWYPFKAHGQAANRIASGSSSLYITFMHIDIRSRPMA